MADGILDDPRACQFDLLRVTAFTPAQRAAIRAVYDGQAANAAAFFLAFLSEQRGIRGLVLLGDRSAVALAD